MSDAALPLFRWLLIVVLLTAVAGPGEAQAPVVVAGAGFVPGGRTLFATDFTQDVVGDFPRGLKLVKGSLDVVERDGIRMLRSTSPAEFIIPLPEPLPAQFTLEFDIVARGIDCCAGEELAIEGSPTLARTAGSAQLLWHHQYLAILGGGRDMGNSTVKVAETLQAELLGQLGHVQIAFDGPGMKLWTNGVRLYNLPDLAFRRSTVLRVYLGGLDDGERAVYLAKIRVAGGGPASPTVAAGQTGGAPGQAAPTAPAAAAAPPGKTGTPYPLNISVTPGQTGPWVSWTRTGPNASSVLTYTVRRWHKTDPCCNATSPALTAMNWADGALSVPGTYVYEVTGQGQGEIWQGTTEFTTQGTTGSTTQSAPAPQTYELTVTVAPGQSGPVVQWPAMHGATYSARRYGANQCCYAQAESLTTATWFDSALPGPGTYIYEVTATSAQGGKVGFGTAQFVVQEQPVSSSSGMVASPPKEPVASVSGKVATVDSNAVPATPVVAPTAAAPTAGTTRAGSQTNVAKAFSTHPEPTFTRANVLYTTYVDLGWNDIAGAQSCSLRFWLKSDPSRFQDKSMPCSALLLNEYVRIAEYPFVFVARLTAVFPDGVTKSAEAELVPPEPSPLFVVLLTGPNGQLQACGTSQLDRQSTGNDWYYWRIWAPGLPPDGRLLEHNNAEDCFTWAYSWSGSEILTVLAAPTNREGVPVVPQSSYWKIQWVAGPTIVVKDWAMLSSISSTYKMY